MTGTVVRLHAIEPRSLLRELDARARARPDAIVLDLSGLDDIDSAGVATLRAASRRLEPTGVALELTGASPSVAHMLRSTPRAQQPAHRPEPSPLERVGESTLAAWHGLLALADLTVETMVGAAESFIGRRTFTVRDVLDQLERMGSDALLIVGTLSGLLGLVLAFQAWVQLHDFGTEVFVLELVGVGMARGFAPFIVAVLLAGRTGPAIAAELSTMEMRQENDALRVMGISPVRHLVIPRLWAMTLVIPGLTLFATATGIVGGIVVSVWLDPSWMSAVRSMLLDMELADLWLGGVKAVLFGWVIVLASAFTGFHSGHGARGIGLAATRAAVSSIFFVMVVDSIVTTIWTMAQ